MEIDINLVYYAFGALIILVGVNSFLSSNKKPSKKLRKGKQPHKSVCVIGTAPIKATLVYTLGIACKNLLISVKNIDLSEFSKISEENNIKFASSFHTKYDIFIILSDDPITYNLASQIPKNKLIIQTKPTDKVWITSYLIAHAVMNYSVKSYNDNLLTDMKEGFGYLTDIIKRR